MPLQVRPGYVNPLTMIKENRNNSAKKILENFQNDKPDKLTQLRTKQQSLQSEILLLQSSGTDSVGNNAEKLDALQKKLEEISSDLRNAKIICSDSTEKAMVLKPNIDTYEKEEKESPSPGIYRLEADQENNRKIICFLPYTES